MNSAGRPSAGRPSAGRPSAGRPYALQGICRLGVGSEQSAKPNPQRGNQRSEQNDPAYHHNRGVKQSLHLFDGDIELVDGGPDQGAHGQQTKNGGAPVFSIRFTHHDGMPISISARCACGQHRRVT